MREAFASDRRTLLRRGLQLSAISAGFLVSPAAAQEAVREAQTSPQAATQSVIPELKLSLEPVSSLRAPAPRMLGSQLRRTRIDAILDQKGARLIGQIDQDNLHREIDIASLTKMSTYFMTEKRLAEGTDYLGRPFSLGTPLRDGAALEEHLYRLLRRSNNYSAQMIATQLCGSIPQFAERVNFELRQLGLRNTHLLNPSGLPGDQDWDGRASERSNRGYSTLYDQAVLVSQIHAHGFDYERYTALDAPTNLSSTNPLFHGDENIEFSRENGVDGLKTGTSNKGTHFVGSARHEDTVISPITLGHVWSRIGDYRNAEERHEDRATVARGLIAQGQLLLTREREHNELLERLQTPPHEMPQIPIPGFDIPPVIS